MRKMIVVLPNGWVLMGMDPRDTGVPTELRDASVVRRWGTTKGLGQLAAEGPLPGTILDPCGTVAILSVLFAIECA